MYSAQRFLAALFAATLLLLGGLPSSMALAATTPTSDFTDNRDGTVTHKATGLTWKLCSEGQTWSGSTCGGTAQRYTWDAAMARGSNGWELPTIEQLRTIVESGHGSPTINQTVFPNTPVSYFWSASASAGYSGYAWAVHFDGGFDSTNGKTGSYYVRLVSGGQSVGTSTPAASLIGLSLTCPSSLAASSSASCTASASFSDGSSKTVSPASWNSSDSAALTVNGGALNAGSVSSDTSVTITASYGEGGITKNATTSVTVKYGATTSAPITSGQEFSASATATGDITRQTLQGRVNMHPSDIGSPGAVFALALLPNSAIYYHGADRSWSPFPQTYFRGALANIDVGIVESPTDLSTLGDAKVYLGYGRCLPFATVSHCYDNMNSNATVHLAHTVPFRQKRSLILFPNPASPIYFVDNSPYGTGIIGRRGATGAISKLDIIKPDGSYYQLALGNSGLPEIKINGYQIAVLAKDANNNATQISVRDPDGVVTSYGDGAVSARGSFAISNETCGGTGGLDDPDFPRTTACHIVGESQHPIIDIAINVAEKVEGKVANKWNWLTDKAQQLRDVFVKGKVSESATEAGNELTRVASKLNNPKGIDENQDNVMVYPNTITPSGTDEASARILLADAKKLGNNSRETNLSAIDPSQLQTLSGYAATHPAPTPTPTPTYTPPTPTYKPPTPTPTPQPPVSSTPDVDALGPLILDYPANTVTCNYVAKYGQPAHWERIGVDLHTGPCNVAEATAQKYRNCKDGYLYSGSVDPGPAAEVSLFQCLVDNSTGKYKTGYLAELQRAKDNAKPPATTTTTTTKPPATTTPSPSTNCSANDRALIGTWTTGYGLTETFDGCYLTVSSHGCTARFTYTANGRYETTTPTSAISSSCQQWVGYGGSSAYRVPGSTLTYTVSGQTLYKR